MSVAIDTNVPVRLLVRDEGQQFAAAIRLVDQAEAADEPVLILLRALLETEWVLRSRYKLDKGSIAGAFLRLLDSYRPGRSDDPGRPGRAPYSGRDPDVGGARRLRAGHQDRR